MCTCMCVLCTCTSVHACLCICVFMRLCVCVHTRVCVPYHSCRGQRTTLGVYSFLLWALRTKLKLSDILVQCFYPPSHLHSPLVTYLHTGIIKVIRSDRTASFKAPWPQIHRDLSLLKCIETVLFPDLILHLPRPEELDYLQLLWGLTRLIDRFQARGGGILHQQPWQASLCVLFNSVFNDPVKRWSRIALDLSCPLSSHFSVVTESEGSVLLP